jgi:hypothetical protein
VKTFDAVTAGFLGGLAGHACGSWALSIALTICIISLFQKLDTIAERKS